MAGGGFCNRTTTALNLPLIKSNPLIPFPTSLPFNPSFPFFSSSSTPRFSGSRYCSFSSYYRSLFSQPEKRERLVCGYVQEEKKEEGRKMTITPTVRLADRKLIVKDRTILSGVPDNVISSSAAGSGPVEGIFLGAVFDETNSRHVVSLGTLRDVRFFSCFRFKLWWMAQKMGERGRDVPLETQFLLVETRDGAAQSELSDNRPIIYTVFLPLVEGPFRACLQGTTQDELHLCIESGDSDTKLASFSHSLFICAGTDPLAAISEAISAVKSHLKTFKHRSEKKLPNIVDYFGWCTWDAFYREVTQEGVEAGLESLSAGGIRPKFVIIDDGWQSVAADPNPDPKTELQLRLTDIKENGKFRSGSKGIENIVRIAKETHGVKYVYVWHAITGYWGGVRPGMCGAKMKFPVVSPGVLENEPGWKADPLAVQGVGLVDPKQVYQFYNELHGYLARAGVDGVKVDVQCCLEILGPGLGGRVHLTWQYHQALDASVANNFKNNDCIDCMSHNTDALYCSKQTAVVRASDDFYPREPASQTIHVASVAYNSVWLGEFMQPDWDMFHSLHPAAEYHASARAISGGPIYVSDAPGKHNFKLLKKLVLPDGSILRARLPGRPTKDCLFTDPTRDGISLLKIWNMNKYTGVLGVYNCQGAAWNAVEKKNTFHLTPPEALTGFVRASDVHLLSEVATDPNWGGDCAVYRHGDDGELFCLPHAASMPISLRVLEHEIFTISPIKPLAPGIDFAPLGLIDMYNGGGAIQKLSYQVVEGAALSELQSGFASDIAAGQAWENRSSQAVGLISMDVKGCGRLGAYSSVKPRKCLVGSRQLDFTYDSSSGLLTLKLDNLPEGGQKAHIVEIEV